MGSWAQIPKDGEGIWSRGEDKESAPLWLAAVPPPPGLGSFGLDVSLHYRGLDI